MRRRKKPVKASLPSLPSPFSPSRRPPPASWRFSLGIECSREKVEGEVRLLLSRRRRLRWYLVNPHVLGQVVRPREGLVAPGHSTLKRLLPRVSSKVSPQVLCTLEDPHASLVLALEEFLGNRSNGVSPP